MGAPWTREGTVPRLCRDDGARESPGASSSSPVADDQFVHKGDLLMVIDPRNFKIAPVGLRPKLAAEAGPGQLRS